MKRRNRNRYIGSITSLCSAEYIISWFERGVWGRGDDGAGEFETEDEWWFYEGAVVLVFTSCLGMGQCLKGLGNAEGSLVAVARFSIDGMDFIFVG